MTDNRNQSTEESRSERRENVIETASASSTYKFGGEIDADDGTGVLGRNTADSGTPIGVEGAVPNNSTGYGLSTPDDARVSGTAELNVLAGALTVDQEVTDLLGPGLALSSGTLTATPARLDVDDGTTSVADVDAITFGSGLTVSDDGDGSATIER